jgi:hypothetical protein
VRLKIGAAYDSGDEAETSRPCETGPINDQAMHLLAGRDFREQVLLFAS